MRQPLRFALAAALAAAIPALARGAPGASPDTPAERLPLEIDAVLRVPVVSVEIAGERVPCLVDTGAYRTTFDTALLRRLFPEAPRVTPTDTAHTDVLQLSLPALRLGAETRRDLPVFETDLAHLTRVSPSGIRGILGMDVLARRPFSLSFARRSLTLGDTRFPAEEHRLDAVREGDRFLVRVKLDNASALMLVDTGANSTQLADSDWKGPKTPGAPITLRHLGGGENLTRTHRAEIAGMRIGSRHFDSPRLLLSDYSLLGVDFIGCGDWHFDPDSARVWWHRDVPAEPPSSAPAAKSPSPLPPAAARRSLPAGVR